MKASRCAFDAAVALRSVFINNVLGTQPRGRFVLPRLFLPSLANPPLQRQAFSVHHALFKKAAPALPRDDEIEDPLIIVRDPETGQLGPPTPTKNVLKQLDLRLKTLVMVKQASADENAPQYPICVIANRRILPEPQPVKGKGKKKKAENEPDKELEIRWGIGLNDLQLKLKKLREFLGKGYTVHVSLLRNRKRGTRVATTEECKQILETVEGVIREIPGTKETQGRSGNLGANYKIFLQGSPKAGPAAPDKAAPVANT
ncbi:hypothetical protein QBC47DRAFT_12580 [Echria macrotheca]|uniref:Translation initiation factor IF-3 n=1 Tax=Echria macrotheca TaxID=438768 RepID=A0AAJ0BM36_9PEZI|nr:hypothetical protein QBC47DRAFT_12580 [Echria macrotheca]